MPFAFGGFGEPSEGIFLETNAAPEGSTLSQSEAWERFRLLALGEAMTSSLSMELMP